MNEVYLLLGSNEGNRAEHLLHACELIRFRCGNITAQSAIYETEAWGLKEQTAFLNQAICIRTPQAPIDLLSTLKKIEAETGRVKTVKWGPRVIDIDILFFNNEVIDLPDLKVPHPYLHVRKFTLMPLSEITPDFMHPLLPFTVRQLLENCSDSLAVKPYN